MTDLSRVLEQSKATDALALLKAKEAAKQKMATDPNPAVMKVMEKASAGLDKIANPSSPGRAFATQIEAVEFLSGHGYQVSTSKLNRDIRKNLIGTTPEGAYDANALLGYARTHCKTRARAEDNAASHAALDRLKADADHKRIMVDLNRLKLEREQGKLMPREEHERELALRAQFFKREVETFGVRLGAEMIALVEGDPERLPAFQEFWLDRTADWMDAWSLDREFAVAAETEEAPSDEAMPEARALDFDAADPISAEPAEPDEEDL